MIKSNQPICSGNCCSFYDGSYGYIFILLRPAAHSTPDIGNLLKAQLPEHLGSSRAPHAALADDDDFLVLIQLIHFTGKALKGDIPEGFPVVRLIFPRRTDVDEMYIFIIELILRLLHAYIVDALGGHEAAGDQYDDCGD